MCLQLAALSHELLTLFLKPRGKHTVCVCDGTTCRVRGSANLLDQVARLLHIKPGQTSADGRFSLETVNCPGSCAVGPAVVIDDKQHMVTDLDRNAFAVYEDGKLQKITSFRHEDIPVSMGIVIDNSGSMAPRQENLAKNFQSFIDVFTKTSIDYRLAITTTDIFKEKVPVESDIEGDPPLMFPVGLNLVKMLCLAQADTLFGEWEDRVLSRHRLRDQFDDRQKERPAVTRTKQQACSRRKRSRSV